MKRAMVMFLMLSLCSVPLFAQNDRLTRARCISLEHVRGAWIMKVECVEGAGSIVMADNGQYHGDGIFSSWSQDKLRTTYGSLVPKDDARLEILQLG
ncbi:MAG TPA: hypothetical protein VLV78_22245 [Thermoanaerobaculia bacterium]|nr:hypothetical protein [Thermoanaerobaculia bacterium]